MPVKPEFASPSTHRDHVLSGWSAARAEGPDAASFLQSQLSSDVLALAVGAAQWSAWLNPKGRVLALILLLRSDESSFDLLMPDHPAESLVAQLSRFILRRKAKLQSQVDRQVLAGIDTPPPPGAVRLDGQTRRWLALAERECEAQIDPAFALRWRLLDARCGLPRLDAEGGGHTAHMLGLDRLAAISLSKGCYPGQEIVARTHYLGQSKRGICCLHADVDAAPMRGTRLDLAGAQIGEVLDAVADPDGGWLLQAVGSGLEPGTRCTLVGGAAEVLPLDRPPLPLA